MNDNIGNLNATLLRSFGPTPSYEVVWDGTRNGRNGRYLDAKCQELTEPTPAVPMRLLKPVDPLTVLGVIKAANMALTKCQIAERSGMGRERTWNELKRLVNAGLVRRIKVGTDKARYAVAS